MCPLTAERRNRKSKEMFFFSTLAPAIFILCMCNTFVLNSSVLCLLLSLRSAPDEMIPFAGKSLSCPCTGYGSI